MKFLIFALFLIICTCQQPFVGKEKVIDECQRYKSQGSPTPQVFNFENKYNTLQEFRVIGWWRYSGSQQFQGTHMAFAFMQRQGNNQIRKFSAYIDSQNSQIQFCTYDLNTKNYNLCKSAPIEVRRRQWLLIQFAYSPQKLRAYAIFQYQNGQRFDIPFDKVRHVDSNFYQLILAQSGNYQNWPGYICKTRIHSGKEAYTEAGFEEEWKQVDQMEDPDAQQEEQENTNQSQTGKKPKYTARSGQKMLVDDLVLDQTYEHQLNQVFLIKDVTDFTEISVVGWFKLFNFWNMGYNVGYVVGQYQRSSNEPDDYFFYFGIDANKNYVFKSYFINSEKGNYEDRKIQNGSQYKYELEDKYRWFLVYQGYSWKLKKMVCQIQFPGRSPITLQQDNFTPYQRNLYRVGVGSQGVSHNLPWSGQIRNFRICIGKGCYYESYPDDEMQTLMQANMDDDKELKKKVELVALKQKVFNPYSGDVPEVFEVERRSYKEFSISAWFKLQVNDQKGFWDGDFFSYGNSYSHLSSHNPTFVDYDMFTGQGNYNKNKGQGQLIFFAHNRGLDNNPVRFILDIDSSIHQKWMYVYFGYQESTKKLYTYITIDGRAVVNQANNNYYPAYHHYEQFVLGGILGEQPRVARAFYGEIRNARVCNGSGCYKESGFESKPPAFNQQGHKHLKKNQ